MRNIINKTEDIHTIRIGIVLLGQSDAPPQHSSAGATAKRTSMNGILTIAFNLFTSSSCATTLLLLPPLFLPDSVLSSPLITLSITLLNNATLFPYAMTAPYGSSFVESNFTASLASSNAFVNARLDDGLGCSAGWASFGDNNKRSGTIS